MEKQTAHISKIESLGVHLDNNGFINISDISEFLVGSKEDLEKALPVGTEVEIEFKDSAPSLTRENVHNSRFFLKGILSS